MFVVIERAQWSMAVGNRKIAQDLSPLNWYVMIVAYWLSWRKLLVPSVSRTFNTALHTDTCPESVIS